MAKTLALILGAVFVLVGVLGFIPNPLVGAEGLFETDLLHDLVHIIFGIILLVVAMKASEKSSKWLIILGVVYLILAVLGFLTIPDGGQLLGLVAMNHADHWLHVVLGVVMVGAGFAVKDRGGPSAPPAPPAAPPAAPGSSM